MDYTKAMNKNKTYTPKEALQADPAWTKPVKLGRGRMPAGGDAHCRALAAKGYRIKGYEVSTSTPTKSAEAPVVKKVNATTEKVVQDFTIRYDERMYKALNSDNKEVGMREVCNNCRVSLVQNHCPNPEILGGIRVSIVPR